jgi:hypothetical protein
LVPKLAVAPKFGGCSRDTEEVKTLGEYAMAERIRRIEPDEFASNEGESNPTLGPWQSN